MSTAEDIERHLVARWAWVRRRRLYRLLGDLLERRALSLDPRLAAMQREVDRHSEQLDELAADDDAKLTLGARRRIVRDRERASRAESIARGLEDAMPSPGYLEGVGNPPSTAPQGGE